MIEEATFFGEQIVEERAVHELESLAHGGFGRAFTFGGKQARGLAEGGKELIDLSTALAAAALFGEGASDLDSAGAFRIARIFRGDAEDLGL